MKLLSKSSRYCRVLAALVALMVGASSQGFDLVYNGAFDIKDSNGFYGDGWTVSHVEGGAPQSNDPDYYFEDWSSRTGAPAGVSAWLNYGSESEIGISQNVNVTSGVTHTLKFDLYSDGFDDLTFDFLEVSLGGDLIASIDVGSDDGDPWNQTFTFNIPVTSTGSKTLSFLGINDFSVDTWVWIDNVSLTPVPEPASMLALAAGAGLLMRRRRSR